MSTWSRLIRFRPSDDPSAVHIGEPVRSDLDVGLAVYNNGKLGKEGEGDAVEVEVKVFSGRSVLDAGEPTGEVKKVGRLLSPLGRDEVGTIRCIGLNVGSLFCLRSWV
jgi:hypothetical protein